MGRICFRWAMVSKVRRIAVLGENTLMIGHSSYIIFYNYLRNEKHLYKLRENYGEQTYCFDGCKTVGKMFVYSEYCRKTPNIYMVSFPDMQCLTRLPGKLVCLGIWFKLFKFCRKFCVKYNVKYLIRF